MRDHAPILTFGPRGSSRQRGRREGGEQREQEEQQEEQRQGEACGIHTPSFLFLRKKRYRRRHLYSWIDPQVHTHEKSIPKKNKRATTNARPDTESSWRE